MDIHSARLTLHRIEPAEAQEIVDGSGRSAQGAGAGPWHRDYPLTDELDPLRNLATATSPHSVFTLYHVRLAATGLAVGGIGFFGPPDAEGVVGIGYGLVEAERGQGFATEALTFLVRFAKENGARSVKADTDEENVASQRVLQKSGFTETHREGGLIFYENTSNAAVKF